MGYIVGLEKAVDTVDQEILLSKLDYYGIRGISNNWFKSYLSNRKRLVSRNVYDTGLAEMNCVIPQGSVLRPIFIMHK